MSRPPGQDVKAVTVYTAADCSLCDRALEVVRGEQAKLGFPLDVVDVCDDPDLEARYRELVPVVEVDGELAFTYFVDGEALRQRVL